MSGGSTTRHTIEVFYQVTNLDKSTKGVQNFNKASSETGKVLDTTSKSAKTTDSSFQSLTKGNKDAENQVRKTGDMFGKFDTQVTKSGKGVTSLADKIRGNRGLTFGMIGLLTSGVEAIGMFGMYADSMANVAQAQAEVNALVASGDTSSQAYTRALDNLNDAERGLHFTQRNMILSFFDLVPFILLTVNSLAKMDTISKLVSKSGDVLRGALAALGLASRTTSSDFDAFWQLQERGPTINQKLGSSFTGITNIFRRDLPTSVKGAGKSFTDFFGHVGIEVKKTDGVLNKMKIGFTSFFSSIGKGMLKIPGLFKVAGAAVVGFGRALLGLLANPIVAILTGISIAIGALIFDFGGLRTALNNVGKALGDTYPALKVILEPLGQISKGLEWLGGQIMHMVGLGDATEETGNKAKTAADNFDPLLEAMQRVFEISSNIDLTRITEQVTKIDSELQNLGTRGTQAIDTVKTVLTNFYGSIKNPTEETARLTHEFRLALIEAAKDGVIYENEAKNLVAIWEKLKASVNGQVQVQKESSIEMHNSANAAKEQSAFLELVNLKVDQLTEAHKKNKNELSTSADIVAKWVVEHNNGVKVSAEMAAKLKDAGAWALVFGKHIKFTETGLVDFTASIKSMKSEQATLEADAGKIWEFIKAKIEDGTITIQDAEKWIKVLGETGDATGEILTTRLEEYKEQAGDTTGVLEDLFKKHQEAAKEAQEAAEKINAEADALGILNETIGMSSDEMERAIALKKDEQKESDKMRNTLQELAFAREGDLNVVKMSIPELTEYIKTHRLQKISADEVQGALGTLIAKREEEVRATSLQKAVGLELLKSMKDAIPVTEMTGKGVMELVNIYNDMSSATRIAADDVGTWYAELQKSQKIEDATIDKLLELANKIKIDIPDSIKQKGIPAIKEYIEQILGIGEGAKKAAEEAKQAFDEMKNEVNDAVNSLIEEDVLEGKAKKVKKILQEIGIEADSMVAHERILQISANTVDFEDDMLNIQEIAQTAFGGIENLSAESGDAVVQIYAEHMEEEWGKKFPGISDSIMQLWEDVKSSAAPGESAGQTIARFVEKLKEGGYAVQEGGKEAIIDTLMKTFDMTKEEATKAAEGVTTGYADKLTSGAPNVDSAAKTGLNDPVNKNAMLIPNEAQTALQPLEGVFSEEFKKATIVSTGEINLILSSVSDAMVQMAKNVGVELGKINTEFEQAHTSIQSSTDGINQELLETQKTASDLSKNIATYTKSMTGNVSGFADSAISDFEDTSDAIFDTQKTTSDLSSNMKTYMNSMKTNVNSATGGMISDFEDLIDTMEDVVDAAKDVKKAIDAIPERKTITIDYKINKPKGVQHGGAWVKGMQHGGSFIADKPMKFDGVNMGEHSKPELVTVTPLTNPNDINDKTIDFDLGNSAFSKSIPRAVENAKQLAQTAAGSGGAGGMSLPQNIEVTVVMPNGEVLARAVKPLLLRNYSAIV